MYPVLVADERAEKRIGLVLHILAPGTIQLNTVTFRIVKKSLAASPRRDFLRSSPLLNSYNVDGA